MRKENEGTYNITAIEIGTCIACHVDDGSLKLTGMGKSTYWDILDPIFLDMLSFFLQKIDDQVRLHVSGAKIVDSNAFGSPLSIA